jgi:hypothetical protein
MDGFDGVGYQLFKLCAKVLQCEKLFNSSPLAFANDSSRKRVSHLKFAIRSILVRRTIIEHANEQAA